MRIDKANIAEKKDTIKLTNNSNNETVLVPLSSPGINKAPEASIVGIDMSIDSLIASYF